MTISLKTIYGEFASRTTSNSRKARSAELIAEQMTLQDLRKARKFTQIRMAELLKLFAVCKILD